MSCSVMRLGEADSHVAVQVGESWVSMWVGMLGQGWWSCNGEGKGQDSRLKRTGFWRGA